LFAEGEQGSCPAEIAAKDVPVNPDLPTFTDADVALMYDVENSWDRVGCWPTASFPTPSRQGHTGQLVSRVPNKMLIAVPERVSATTVES
jgi:hypothetical protein